MDYMTMVCDIKSSHEIENRETLQYKLIDMLKEANHIFSADISDNFIITLGDEWQGLLKYPCNYTSIIDYFENCLKDVQFYCGIGIGEVSVHNFELTVNQLDGPSFFKARKAIEIAKQLKCSLVIIK